MKWIRLLYIDIKEFYTLYIVFLSVFIGLFCVRIDCKKLKQKHLKREAKICRSIGWIYILGSVSVYILLNIF